MINLFQVFDDPLQIPNEDIIWVYLLRQKNLKNKFLFFKLKYILKMFLLEISYLQGGTIKLSP